MGNISNIQSEESVTSSKLAEFLDQPETTSNSKRIGKLQSEISGTIHTKQAAQLIHGADITNNSKNKSDKKHKAIGLYNFSVKCSKLESSIKKDDPFADCIFYHIHEEVNLERKQLAERVLQFKNWIDDSVPKNLSLSEAINLKPLKLDFKFNSTMAFQILFLILELDEYFKLIKLAQHVALIQPNAANKMIQDNMRLARRIMSNINLYKHSDVTRNDVVANNQRARKAAESMPMIAMNEQFITGELRSKLAPHIASRPELTAADGFDIPGGISLGDSSETKQLATA